MEKCKCGHARALHSDGEGPCLRVSMGFECPCDSFIAAAVKADESVIESGIVPGTNFVSAWARRGSNPRP